MLELNMIVCRHQDLTKLQTQLDSPAPGTERYLSRQWEYLQIVTLGEDRIIGRFVKTVFLAVI
jgi:hypothetical protein